MDDAAPVDEAEVLRVYLSSRDVPCPHCEYNLRNLTGSVCPECGEEVTLRLQSVDPRQAASIVGLILLSAGAGLNGLLLIYAVAVIMIYQKGMHDGFGPFLRVNGIGFVICATFLVIWLKFWRKIRRLSSRQRWLLVVACALAIATDLVCFIKYLR